MKIWTFFAILFFPFACLTAQNKEFDDILLKIKAKYNVVGMSVTVVKDKQVIHSNGYGDKDLTRNLVVDARTKYRVASISKMVAATALMQLFEKGHFKMDDDISRYIGFTLVNPRYKCQPITFEMLLSHTGSLRDGSKYATFLKDTASKPDIPHLKELLMPGGEYYSDDAFSAKGPNSKYFTYANVNFGVVATLVEKFSGVRFDEYCEKNILQPLGINGSFNVNHLPDIDDVAVLYRKTDGQWIAQVDNFQGVCPPPRDLSKYVLGTNGFIFAPQGGLRISADELTRFMIAHQNGGQYRQARILKPETVALMQQLVWSYDGNNGDPYDGVFKTYALGNHTTKDLLPSETLTGHPGEAYGLISDMYFSQPGNYGVVFITNGGCWGKGQYSGWYDLEEQVFQACLQFIQQGGK